MLSRVQQWARRSTASTLCAVFVVVLAAPAAFAQEQPSLLGDTLKNVVLDPTTYAPAAIAYDATMRDWHSSQPFFRNGYLERNERFTISGRPNDMPVSYQVGRQRILQDAFLNLQVSVVTNVTSHIFEHTLADRFPKHRKLVRTLGWLQRIGLASYLSYRLSAAHYRQAEENQRRAAQLGLR